MDGWAAPDARAQDRRFFGRASTAARRRPSPQGAGAFHRRCAIGRCRRRVACRVGAQPARARPDPVGVGGPGRSRCRAWCRVVTGADLLDPVSPLPTNWILPGMQVPVHRVLADEVARFQGEGVAAVVAVDAYTAADAVAAIEVDYEPLPAVTDPWQAAQPGAALVHPGLAGAAEDGNVVFRVPISRGRLRGGAGTGRGRHPPAASESEPDPRRAGAPVGAGRLRRPHRAR